MSIEINLLPWREAQRGRRSQRFYLALVLMAVLGLGAGLGMMRLYQEGVVAQQQRNAHIRERMDGLESDIRAITEYEATRERMVGQIELFSELQRGRSQTVQVLRDLTTSLVDGVHYTALSRQDDQLRLTGLAETNHQVSDQLRALAAAESLAEPALSEVESDNGARRRFDLRVVQLPANGSNAANGNAQEVP